MSSELRHLLGGRRTPKPKDDSVVAIASNLEELGILKFGRAQKRNEFRAKTPDSELSSTAPIPRLPFLAYSVL
jgi:hypothetical protein